MKKPISLLLVLVLLISCVPFSVSADSSDDSVYDAVYKAVYDAIYSCGEKVDVKEYDVSPSYVSSLITDVLDDEPLFFYYQSAATYYNPNTMKSSYIVLYYKYEIDECLEMRDFAESEIDKIVNAVPQGLDEYQQVLFVHDYICTHFNYDYTYSIYDIYNLLKQGVGVCQAYSELFCCVIEEIGIPCAYVQSDSLHHIWNEVNLNGNWYQVDVTWDDTVANLYGHASHLYFLQSDSASADIHDGATDIVTDYPCSDTSFDGYSWHDAVSLGSSPAAFVDGKSYEIVDKIIKEIDLATDVSTDLYEITDRWFKDSTSYYVACYSSLVAYGNRIIFNTDKEIVSYDLETAETTVLHSPDIGTKNIYGILLEGKTVYYSVSQAVGEGDIYSFELPFEDEADVLKGDVNCDGRVTAVDYFVLRRAVFNIFSPDEAAFNNGDYNDDGKLSVVDCLMVKRAVLGYID